MAILFRTNSQSRVLEEKLMRYSIPYTMVGGTKFYDRKGNQGYHCLSASSV